MKERLRIFWALFAILIMPLGAWGDSYFAINTTPKGGTWVSDTPGDDYNVNNILGDGTMSYDVENNVLTLNGINLTLSDDSGAGFIAMVDEDHQSLTVQLIGENHLTLEDHAYLFYGTNITFTTSTSSPGSLTITTSNNWTGNLFVSSNNDGLLNVYYNDNLKLAHTDDQNTYTIQAAYNLWICGEQVTSANAGNIKSGVEEGTVTFAITDEPATGGKIYTLTLNNATISQFQDIDAILFNYPILTVHLIGENHIENGFAYLGTDATGTVEFTSDGGEENCLIFNNASSPEDLIYNNSSIYTTGFYNCTYNTISDDTGWAFKQTNEGKLKLYRKNTIDYGLSIGGIAVTSDNASDILGDKLATQAFTSSFQYLPDLNKLFITNNTDGLSIETSNDEGLTIYLAPNSRNTIGDIVYTGNDRAPLTITTDGNYPGSITMNANAANVNARVISGFSSLTLEQNLVIMDPEDITYHNRVLLATSATIGVPLSPITKEKTIIPNGTELQPEPGSDDINKVVDDILYTLGNANSSDGDGYDTDDDGSGFIVINSVTTDQQAVEAAQNYAPGTAEYLERFKGLTFMVPAGKGKVTFDVQTLNGYAMKVMVGDAVPVIVENAEKGIVEIPYNVAEPTYVYVWNAGKSDDANNARSIHKGKMTTVHIKINGTSVKPNQVKPSNSAAQASGGEYNGDVSGLEGQELETLEEIEASKGDVNGDETSNVADIIGIVNAIRGEHSTTFDRRAADVDGNNIIDADDIVRLVEKMMGQ